ncbi:hypothetical protein LXL04_003421 [Taraxacum kok-saghyz]
MVEIGIEADQGEGQSSSGANNVYFEDFDMSLKDSACSYQKMKGCELQEQRKKRKCKIYQRINFKNKERRGNHQYQSDRSKIWIDVQIVASCCEQHIELIHPDLLPQSDQPLHTLPQQHQVGLALGLRSFKCNGRMMACTSSRRMMAYTHVFISIFNFINEVDKKINFKFQKHHYAIDFACVHLVDEIAKPKDGDHNNFHHIKLNNFKYGKLRLDGMGGIRPAVCHLAEFTAGVGGGMAFSSGKLCQRQTLPTAKSSGLATPFTSAKLYLPLHHKSLPAANSPKSENILRVAYVAQFASANFTYDTDQSKIQWTVSFRFDKPRYRHSRLSKAQKET